MKIAILIITYQRKELLKNLLKSIKDNNHNDIFIAINGNDTETENFLQKNQTSFFKIKKTTPAEARNFLIRKINEGSKKYDYFGFLDDDTLLPRNYIKNLLAILNNNKIDIVGGPEITYPNSTYFEKCAGITQQSPLAMGKTILRHTYKKNKFFKADEKDLILCNLWFRKNIIVNNYFTKGYFRNEENVLLFQLKNKNISFFYSSDLFLYHKKKGNPFKLFKSIKTSGYFRLKSFFNQKQSSQDLIYYIPFIFILYILSLPIFKVPFFLFLYFILVFLFSLYFSIQNKLIFFPGIFLNHILINISYGIGFCEFLFFNRLKRILYFLSKNFISN